MRCVVTGGAGFIGSHIVNRLVEDGHEVVVIDDLSTGKKENVNPKANLRIKDITTMRDTDWMVLAGTDIVFHLAAFPRVEPSIEQPVHAHNINVNGTINLLDGCRIYGVKRVVFTSSSAVYGEAETPTNEFMETNPMSPYALHKLIGEEYCKLFSKLYDIETISLRYSNAYGEGQPTEGAYCNVMGIFTQQKDNGEKLTIVGDGEQRRDFIHVNDIVEANIQALLHEGPLKGAVFNIGYGKNYSVNQIAEWIGGETTNIAPRIEPRETLLDSSAFQECFDWEPTIDLEKWIGSIMRERPVSRKKAEERLRYLNTEIAHERYWDGWSIKAMKEEKEWLESQLEKLDAR